MALSEIIDFIRDLSTPLSFFGKVHIIYEKGVHNPKQHVLHVESDKAYEKVGELYEMLENVSENEREELKALPIDCCFFARLVLAIEKENRMDMEKSRPYSSTQTKGYHVLKHFSDEKDFFTLLSKKLDQKEMFFLPDFSTWHLNFIEYFNPLASLAFDKHADLFNYCRLISELNAWVNETSSKYQRIERWASLSYICEYFFSGVSLNLSECYIDTFPTCIEKFKKIKILVIPPSLKEVPSSLEHLEVLIIQPSELLYDEIIEEDLKTYEDAFDPNQETVLPKGLTRLKSLSYLTLDELNLKELPEEIFEITQLEGLTCTYSSLEKLSPSIKKLKNLTELNLKLNELKELPKEIFELEKLEFLNLSDNEIRDFYIKDGTFKKLYSLNVQNNEIKTFPLECQHLTALTELVLCGNQIKEIPSSIHELSSLSAFYITHNQLTQLPDSLGDLKSLQKLYLENNQLSSLPEMLMQLENLSVLNLSHNAFTSLPEGLSSLEELYYLDLSHNFLTEIKPETKFSPNLKNIDLSHNKLSHFPVQFIKLELLTELNLSHNQIETLPTEINSFLILQKLDLSNNQIKEIHPSLGHLKALFYLNLSHNCIEKLPPSFSELTRLTHFYLGIESAFTDPKFNFLKELDQQAQKAGGLSQHTSNWPCYLY